MDEMLTYTSQDGILMVGKQIAEQTEREPWLMNEVHKLQTDFDRSRPLVDPVVCVNALRLFYLQGREKQVSRTFDWVLDVLRNRAYQAGTRYYPSPDLFLYFLTRLTYGMRTSVLSFYRCWKAVLVNESALTVTQYH